MKKDAMEQFDRFFSELKNGYHYNPLISNESGRADTSNKSESKLQNTDTTTVDAVVVFALKDPERKMFQKACASSSVNDIKNGVVFQILDIKGEKRSIRIALATQREMGMVSAAIISTIALMTYRPKVIVMGGICAGVEGKVNIGDIIVANPTFNHEAGKKTERGFEAFFTQRNLTSSP